MLLPSGWKIISVDGSARRSINKIGKVEQMSYKDVEDASGLCPNSILYTDLVTISFLLITSISVGIGIFVNSAGFVGLLAHILLVFVFRPISEADPFLYCSGTFPHTALAFHFSRKYKRLRELFKAVAQYNAWVVALKILVENDVKESVHPSDLAEFLRGYQKKIVTQMALDRAQREGDYGSILSLSDAPAGYDEMISTMNKYKEDKVLADIMKELE